jgi:protein TonB
MFEDALVESAGRLKTQSKYWTFGAFALNAGLLAILILIPLLHPEALPKTAIARLLIAPTPPLAAAPAQTTARPQAAQRSVVTEFRAPSIPPTHINESDNEPAPEPTGMPPGAFGPGTPVAGNPLLDIIGNGPRVVVSRPNPSTGPVHVSTGVAAGYLITRTQPVYPVIAQMAHITGSVVLHAVISKTGTIENLVVESGPVMLRQAALDGVRNWRYRPFLLNGDPTKVDTTITVNFTSSS